MLTINALAAADSVIVPVQAHYLPLKGMTQLYVLFYVRQRCRTDFADIQNKKDCGGNKQWQNHYLRNWAADTSGKAII